MSISEKNTAVSVLAAKNVFVRGSIFMRVRRIMMVFVIPLYFVYVATQEKTNRVELSSFTKLALDQLSFSEYFINRIFYPWLIPLLIIFTVSWLWQLFLCVGVKDEDRLKMNEEEKIFVKVSFFMFVSLFVFVGEFILFLHSWEYHDVFEGIFGALYGMLSFGFIFFGIFLTIKARKKIPVFLDLMWTTFGVAFTFVYNWSPLFEYMIWGGK